MFKVKFLKDNHMGLKVNSVVAINGRLALKLIGAGTGELVNKGDEDKLEKLAESLKPKKAKKKTAE